MAAPLKGYPLVLQQPVIWGDMDAFGHVNNTVYLRYFEDARMAYFDKTGVSAYMHERQIGPILAAVNCDFRKPLTYPDSIFIGARATIAGPKKINVEYAVYSEQFGAIAAEGSSLVIFYDYERDCSCEIPESIAAEIAAFGTGS